jgi:hypothetical protein
MLVERRIMNRLLSILGRPHTILEASETVLQYSSHVISHTMRTPSRITLWFDASELKPDTELRVEIKVNPYMDATYTDYQTSVITSDAMHADQPALYSVDIPASYGFHITITHLRGHNAIMGVTAIRHSS